MLDEFKRVEASERKRLHCAKCKRKTIHNLEARCSGSWTDPRHHESGWEWHSIFRCGACDQVCYETAEWDTYVVDYDEDGDPYNPKSYKQYPPPVSAHFDFNTEYTPLQLNEILDEMLYALAGAKMVLATIGLRLAVEYIVKDKKCKGRNLEKRIDDLFDQGHVDADQKDLLHRIRLLGNAGAHEAKGMSANEIIGGMAIVEGLLERLYNGPARHEAMINKGKKLLLQTGSNKKP
ncbi:DUF4145 domain-containing protein [uncultured Novosphingobium sp.]|uniref:DUF4145 domain-containing protein n=1 Tax=uncultured Novosphingobium sp. TaxID=292277 RepID=UPI00258B17B0|nr:DUF4145 domain-containing protein [uncultured Novosphingobium sp.]